MPDHTESSEDLSMHKSIFKNSLDAILITKPDGSILTANPAAEEMFGMNHVEIVDAGRDGLFVENQAFKSALKELRKKGRVKARLNFKRKDGSIFSGEAIFTLFKDKKEILKINLIIRDIKYRELAEEKILSISDVKSKTEKALLESEKKYHSLYSSMSEGVALHDIIYNFDHKPVDYVITDVNPAYEYITGLKRNKVLGKKASELYGTENPPYLEIYAQIAENGVSTQFESYFEPMDKYFRISVTSSDKGKFTTFFEDITELRLAKDHLHNQTKILSVINDAIIVTDKSYRITSWNAPAEKLYGWKEEEVLGKPAKDILRSKLIGMEREMAYNKLYRGESVATESVHFTKDGRELIIKGYTVPLTDIKGNITGYVAINQDITQSKQAEEKLKYQADLLYKVSDALISTDIHFRIKTWNKAAEKIYGWSEQEVIGRPISEILHTKYLDNDEKQVLKQFQTEKNWFGEVTQLRKDGKKIYVQSNVTLLNDDFGNPSGAVAVNRDITNVKHSELEMRLLNDRIEIASRAAGVGIWDWDIITGQLEWSPVMYDLFGLDPQKTEASFEVWENILNSEDLENASLNIELALEENTYLNNEYRIVLPNGQIEWINALGQAEYDDQGRPQRMTGICINITERKKNEEELKNRAALLNVSNEAIFSWSCDEGVLSWNQGAERLYGYTAKEAIGSSSHELLKTEFPFEFNEFMQKLDNDNGWNGELFHTKKDGEKIIIESHMQLIQNTSGEKIVIETNRDITQRKQIEQKLKETLDNLEEKIEERTHELLLANNYNRNLLETALDPLVTIGPDGKITDVNRATEKVTGYSSEKLIGTDFANYFTNPPEAKKVYQKVFKLGMVRDYPLKIRHIDGHLTPVLYNASVYKDELGEVVGVFAAARDMTELKKAEEELGEYWKNLEEQVKLRTEELAKSNADLEQFAYVASHDLREPLRMINSFLQLLERRYKSQLDDDAKEFIDFAMDGAKRLDKMIMDLLEYSRVANKEMMFTEVDFEKVIHQIKFNLNVRIHENNAEITCDQLPKNVRADMNQMIILFQNLISNSIKYRSDENPKIHISSLKENDHYVFSVKDNGIGIEPKHLKRVFTIFQRLHTHQEYEGSGIGLSIVQRIVHQHGGEIWVKSEPGKGSTFQFTIKNY